MDSEAVDSTHEWLPLGRAAERLNVHPTTLRRWADDGEIPVMLTPGGHRRFSSTDLAQFAQQRKGLRRVSDLERVWADEALSQTRRELVVHQDDNWLAGFDDDSRLRHRNLGQQLMGLTLRYLSEEDGEGLLGQAQEIGRQYAALSMESAMPLAEALRAAMFFRDTLVETALNLPDDIHVRPEASLRLLRRINRLLNTVHLAIAEVYDATYADSVPGP
ncbi:MAG TPA: helix-turn-helix domain-containing protein [Candidatus Binatia bacterium]|jgi:excisionase family DNA binding protein|nr:helix-turn-helix domain-containing protein [Candidatus Binatia bacterium]